MISRHTPTTGVGSYTSSAPKQQSSGAASSSLHRPAASNNRAVGVITLDNDDDDDDDVAFYGSRSDGLHHYSSSSSSARHHSLPNGSASRAINGRRAEHAASAAAHASARVQHSSNGYQRVHTMKGTSTLAAPMSRGLSEGSPDPLAVPNPADGRVRSESRRTPPPASDRRTTSSSLQDNRERQTNAPRTKRELREELMRLSSRKSQEKGKHREAPQSTVSSGTFVTQPTQPNTRDRIASNGTRTSADSAHQASPISSRSDAIDAVETYQITDRAPPKPIPLPANLPIWCFLTPAVLPARLSVEKENELEEQIEQMRKPANIYTRLQEYVVPSTSPARSARSSRHRTRTPAPSRVVTLVPSARRSRSKRPSTAHLEEPSRASPEQSSDYTTSSGESSSMSLDGEPLKRRRRAYTQDSSAMDSESEDERKLASRMCATIERDEYGAPTKPITAKRHKRRETLEETLPDIQSDYFARRLAAGMIAGYVPGKEPRDGIKVYERTIGIEAQARKHDLFHLVAEEFSVP